MQFIKKWWSSLIGLGVLAVVFWPTPEQLLHHRLHGQAVADFAQLHASALTVPYDYFCRGLTNQPVVTLTFDDGPNVPQTARVLDVLKEYQVQATFFVIGQRVRLFPGLVERMVVEGHDVGSHSYYHQTIGFTNEQQWADEIALANRAIAGVLGNPPRWFRAPGCHYSADALTALHQSQMVRVDPSNNGFDYDKTNASVVLNQVLFHLKPGDIILLHQTGPSTLAALPKLIQAVRQKGYQFVPLQKMMELARATPGFQPEYCPPDQGIILPHPVPAASAAGAKKIEPAVKDSLPDDGNQQ